MILIRQSSKNTVEMNYFDELECWPKYSRNQVKYTLFSCSFITSLFIPLQVLCWRCLNNVANRRQRIIKMQGRHLLYIHIRHRATARWRVRVIIRFLVCGVCSCFDTCQSRCPRIHPGYAPPVEPWASKTHVLFHHFFDVFLNRLLFDIGSTFPPNLPPETHPNPSKSMPWCLPKSTSFFIEFWSV